MSNYTEVSHEPSDDAEDVRPPVAADDPQLRRVRPLFILPIVFGVLILGLDIVIWRLFWAYLAINPAALTLIATSASVGLVLIVYGIILWLSEWHREKSVVWVMGLALAAALLAPAFTLWGAQLARPVPPRPSPHVPCIDLYQQASEIKAVNPNFVMSTKDPDQRRCDINAALG